MICYEYINEFIRKETSPNNEYLKSLERYSKINGVPIIKPETAKLIAVFIRVQKPVRILEVGTGIGYSSILFSYETTQKTRIDTIEKDENMFNLARNNIKEANMQNRINVILGEGQDVLPCLNKKYDLIFLDASKGKYIEMLPHCLRILNNGGVLISDNILYKGMVADDKLIAKRKRTIVNKMRKYINELCNTPVLETSIVPIGDGLSISFKKERENHE